MSSNTNNIQQLYVAYFGRPADATGLAYWETVVAAQDGSTTAVSAAFAASAEYTATFAGLSNDQIVNTIYNNLFHRDAEVAGLTYWSNLLTAGRINISNAVTQVAGGAQGTDSTALAQKVAASVAFTAALDTTAEILSYNGTAAVAVAKAWLAGIYDVATETAAVATAALNATVASLATAITGQTYTLTTSADNISASNANNVINGLVDFAAGTAPGALSTYNTADVIHAGTGTNTLNLTLSNAATGPIASFSAPDVSGISVVNIRNVSGQDFFATGAGAYDVAGLGGATTITSDRSSGKLFLKNIASGSTIGIVGNGVVTNGNVEANYAAAATKANVAVSGGTLASAVALVGAGLTTVGVTSTGSANVLTSLDVAGASAVNINATTGLDLGTGIATTSVAGVVTVSGTGAVKLGALDTGVITVTATDNSGGVSATISAVAQVITGGSGNDTITTGGVQTGAVDAGAGTGDKLIVAAAVDVAATPAAKFSNFEVLQNNAVANLDVALFTKSTFTSGILNASGAGLLNMSAVQAGAISNIANNAGATLSLADSTGSSDVLSVTLKNATATTSADLSTVTVNGFETLNVVSTSGSFADISLLSFTSADKLTALNLSGAAPINVVTTNIAKAVTIDASKLTATPLVAGTDFTLTESGTLIKGSVVTGSETADSFTLLAIAGTTGDFVTIHGGAGNDLVSTTAAILNNTAAGNGSHVLDGGAGTDTLSFSEVGVTLVDANLQYVTSFEKITVAAAGAVSIVSGGFFDTNFKTNGVTITDTALANTNATVDLTSFSGAATVTLTTTASTAATAVNGGSAVDTITVSAAGITIGSLAISAGAGNDVIKVTSAAGTITAGTGTITIDGGAGQDTVTLTTGPSTTRQGTVTFTEHAGHSTLTAADGITGFALADGTTQSYTINFDGTGTVAANASAQAVTGYTSAELTYTIASGLLTFAGTSAAGLTVAQEATIAQQVVTTADKGVVFTFTNADATVDTYVFEHNTGGDSLVKLVGVTATGAEVVAGGHTLGYVTIA